jgi:hypothetical protein
MVASANPDWPAAPYRVHSETSSKGRAFSAADLWEDADGWLVASDHRIAQAVDAADWLIVRE